MVSMAKRVTEYAKVCLSLDAGIKGRGSTVYPDDTFLVSYPRSGNTWSRFLVFNLVFTDEPANFLNVEKRVPDIHGYSDWVLRGVPRPRYLKSHECFDPRYKRILYIVRDPRDVVVSTYHYRVKTRVIPDGYPIATFAERWMESAWKAEWGTWEEHVQSWRAMRRDAPGFFLVRYEDLKSRTNEELTRIANFLGVQRSNEQIARAVELSSANRMRNLEKAQKKKWKGTKNTRHDKPFVRKATSGDWRTALPKESVERIESAWGPLMEELGYPTGPKALEETTPKPASTIPNPA